MKYKHRDGKTHDVVYIEYHDGKPFDVKTSLHIPYAVPAPYNRLHNWDFERNEHWGGDLMFYLSGSGGHAEIISAPKFVDGTKGVKIWIKDGHTFDGTPENCVVIKKPLVIRQGKHQSKNPFVIAEEVSATCYCDRCDGRVGDSYCYIHMAENDEGELYYTDNGELVEE